MKIDNGLFSEVYGCYYTVVAQILAQAREGMSKAEIETLVSSKAFGDSAFHLLPKLFSGEWSLIEQKEDGLYYSRLQSAETVRPMTDLEKSWLKALLLDKRIHVFARQDELSALENALSDVAPLFFPDDFHIFDSAADGDLYEDADYIRNFRAIVSACVSQKPIRIEYESGKRKWLIKTVLPYKLNYSGRDDKFRLRGVLLSNGVPDKGITINLARIRSIEETQTVSFEDVRYEEYFDDRARPEPIVLEIYKERGALERCMLQFASWEKQTEYDEERDCYTCRIYYDEQDETELLIRILSFGPVVRVLGPEVFLKQIKERVRNQYRRITCTAPR